MKKTTSPASDACVLRQQAEPKRRVRPPPAEPVRDQTDPSAPVHELEVQRIKLEMQNEEVQRAQEEARQAPETCTELFDVVPVAYFALDPRGLVSEVNLAGAALLGLERRHVTGQPFELFVDPRCRAEFAELWRSVRLGKARRSCEVQLLQQGREPRDVLVEATGVGAGPGERPCCRLAMIDITDRKRAEEKVRQFNKELEQRLADRTAELSARNSHLTRFQLAMEGREMVMVDLKKEINALCALAGQPPRYPVGSHEAPRR